MTTLTRLFPAVFLLATLSPLSGADPAGYDPRIDSAQAVRAALLEAKKRHVNVLLDLGGDWCIDCRRLDAFFGGNAAARAELERNFVLVKIYVGDERDNSAFLMNLPSFNWVPYFFVLDSNGKLLGAQDTRDLTVNREFQAGKVQAFLRRWTVKK